MATKTIVRSAAKSFYTLNNTVSLKRTLAYFNISGDENKAKKLHLLTTLVIPVIKLMIRKYAGAPFVPKTASETLAYCTILRISIIVSTLNCELHPI